MNVSVLLPTTALTVTAALAANPAFVLTSTWHDTDVLEDQDAVEHDCDARSNVAVRSVVRKFTPLTVSVPPDVVAVFSADMKLTAGAEKETAV